MSRASSRTHADWTTQSFGLPPVADRIGPFVSAAFLSTWSRHRGKEGQIELADSGEALLPLFRTDGAVAFAGDADLTDYHSPLGTGVAELLASYVTDLPVGTTITLDSLPAAAAKTVEQGLELSGLVAQSEQHEAAAILDLPESWDDFLLSLSKKQRHEVRRKYRRFTEQLGTASLERVEGVRSVAMFAEMHREAFGDKGGFMTDHLERFFADLHADVDARLDVVTIDGGEIVAAAFGFDDPTTYYLYNSAYRTAHRESSPGIVLIALLIRSLINAGKTRLDFLKGDEEYKYRLGAVARPLYRVTATAGGTR